eukprot:8375912-Karenia_brevis.AAC.1
MQHQYSLSGKQRRKMGMQKMITRILELESQVEFMTQVIQQQQHELDAYEAAHASPELFDASLAQ